MGRYCEGKFPLSWLWSVRMGLVELVCGCGAPLVEVS